MYHGCLVAATLLILAWGIRRISLLTSTVSRPSGITFLHDLKQLSETSQAELPPLKVACQGSWGWSETVMGELWLLSTISERFLGRKMVPAGPSSGGLGYTEQQEVADIILFGPYGPRMDAESVARKYGNRTVSIFIGSENQDKATYYDQMVDHVDISFGHRRDLHQDNYLRLPWWLPYALQKEHGCKMPPIFHKPTVPSEWLARTGFATLLSRHYAYPRRLLFEMMSGAGYGRVDAPSKAFHNIEWPANLPNHHLNGKVEFISSYRFNICPENSKTSDGGYNTEKLPQAHMAGAVPIYWGDAPIDAEVFNPKRIIHFDGTNSSVLDTVRKLQEDKSFREQWFAEPVLMPTADEWVEAWCANAGKMIAEAVQKAEAYRLVLPR